MSELNATLNNIVNKIGTLPNGKFPTIDTIIYNWNNPQIRYDSFHQTFLRPNGFSAQSPQPGQFVDLTQWSEGEQPSYTDQGRSVLVVAVERSATNGEVYHVVGIDREFRGSPVVTFVPIGKRDA